MIQRILLAVSALSFASCEAFSTALRSSSFSDAVSQAAQEAVTIHAERGGLNADNWMTIAVGFVGAIITSIWGSKKLVDKDRGEPKIADPDEQRVLKRMIHKEMAQ